MQGGTVEGRMALRANQLFPGKRFTNFSSPTRTDKVQKNREFWIDRQRKSQGEGNFSSKEIILLINSLPEKFLTVQIIFSES